MIYGNIQMIKTEKALPEAVRRALEVIRTKDVATMEPGKYPVDGDRMILQINVSTTEPKENRRAEVHRKYVDVQYMVSGREYIGVYPDPGTDAVAEDRMEADDILFYDSAIGDREVMLPMTEGCFAVFFPEDAHRPGCEMGGPQEVRKVIVKVATELF